MNKAGLAELEDDAADWQISVLAVELRYFGWGEEVVYGGYVGSRSYDRKQCQNVSVSWLGVLCDNHLYTTLGSYPISAVRWWE